MKVIWRIGVDIEGNCTNPQRKSIDIFAPRRDCHSPGLSGLVQEQLSHYSNPEEAWAKRLAHRREAPKVCQPLYRKLSMFPVAYRHSVTNKLQIRGAINEKGEQSNENSETCSTGSAVDRNSQLLGPNRFPRLTFLADGFFPLPFWVFWDFSSCN